MADYLINAPDMATLNAYAATLGAPFWDGQAIVPQGPLPGGGEYFANFAQDMVPSGNTITDAFGNQVPEMVPLTGVWVRLRLNGENMFALGLLPMPPAPIVVYPPVKYLADGVTVDTSYTQPPYGQIA